MVMECELKKKTRRDDKRAEAWVCMISRQLVFMQSLCPLPKPLGTETRLLSLSSFCTELKGGSERCSVGQRKGKNPFFTLVLLWMRTICAPAGVPAMVWHLNHTIFTDLNTNGYCLIVSWFISQTSSPLPPAQLLQSKPLSLNRPDYYFPSKVLICVTST